MRKLTQEQIDDMVRGEWLRAAQRVMQRRILKGLESAKLDKMHMNELEDRMHKMGHTDFEAQKFCSHSITEDRPNPNGNMFKTFCKYCGKEII